MATIAAAFYPKPVIVRLSDFKSNEYRKLLGGELYEPEEETHARLPWRLALHRADLPRLLRAGMPRHEEGAWKMGLTNVELMVPFVRTVEEGKGVVKLLAEHGLKQGENDLKADHDVRDPVDALLADDFLDVFDGFSIGSNDLTQLTLGLDRDSGLVASLFDERDPAVKMLLAMAIASANKKGKYRYLRPGPRTPRSGRMADGSGHQQHLAEPGYGWSTPAAAGQPQGFDAAAFLGRRPGQPGFSHFVPFAALPMRWLPNNQSITPP